MAAYGKCLALKAEVVEKGVCEEEFRIFMNCAKKVSFYVNHLN